MKNFATQCGDHGGTMQFTGIAVAAGAGVLIGDIFGVSMNTYLSTEVGIAALEGGYVLAKTTGEAWTVGLKLYWDDSTKKITSTAGSLKRAGVALAIAASGDTTGPVNINRGY